jgi:hypothetical protein
MWTKRLRFLLLLLLCGLFSPIIAQNEINSPYSSFGVGNLSPRTNTISGAMGGVGYALQNPYYINFKNPASYAAFDSLSFIADLAFSVVNQQLKTDRQQQKGTYAQLGYIAIGLPVLKVWRTSVGIMPYSDRGYGILDTRAVPVFGEEETANYRYQGEGGIQLLYWGNAFKVCKGFNIGFNLSYLFGTLNTLYFAEYSLENSLNTLVSNFRYLDGIYVSGGAQYHATVKEKHHLGIGAVYENSLKVWSRENRLVMNYVNEYSPSAILDTVDARIGKDALRSNVKMPQIVGVGVSYGYKDRLMTAVDFSWQNWKNFSMSNMKDTLKNNITTAIGVQYVPNPTSSKYYNKINFRLGARVSTGYMKIYEKPISEFAVSAGLGFPVRTFNFRSSANIMFEYSRMGTLKNNLIVQNYFKLSFNFILQERWYQRRKIE